MKLKDEVIDPTTLNDWDKKIITFKGYSFFHSSAWAKVIKETYNYNPKYILIKCKNEDLAILPAFEIKTILGGKKGVALPFSDHCRFLIKENIRNDVVIENIIQCARGMKWKSLELRECNKAMKKYPVLSKYNLHIMELSKKDNEIKAGLRNSTWRNIKKARKNNVEVLINTNKGMLDNYYRLHCQTRKYHGIPPQPYKFFKKIHEHILEQNKGVVVIAKKGENIIAGAIFFHIGNYATYKYGASNREYQSLRASNLVIWEAIQYYKKNDYKIIDFGRTERDNVGLNQFKNGWGACSKELSYFRYDILKNKFVNGEKCQGKRRIKALSALPTPILKIIGNIAYRHMT